MLVFGSRYWERSNLPLATAVVAFSLCVPVVVFSIMGYEVNSAFLMAPLVVYALALSVKDPAAIAYLISGVCGLISIWIAAILAPDDETVRHLLSLTLFMIPPSFVFLGAQLGKRIDIPRIVFWLAIASSVFVIATAVRLVVLGESFRFATEEGRLALNAEFMGIPVFAAEGVNSLAHLLAIQSIIIAGALVDTRSLAKCSFLFAGLSCAIYLSVASSARGTQLVIGILIVFLIGAAIFRPHLRAALAVSILAIGVGAMVTVGDGMLTRLIGTVTEVAGMKFTAPPGTLDTYVAGDISNGRVELITAAWHEFVHSPIFGSGFASFGRGIADADEFDGNRSSHLYYLTVLWKGGLLLAVPFFAFIGILFWRAAKEKKWSATGSGAFASLAVIATFCILSLTWDILNVPSAGALAWFLLGALGGPKSDGKESMKSKLLRQCVRD